MMVTAIHRLRSPRLGGLLEATLAASGISNWVEKPPLTSPPRQCQGRRLGYDGENKAQKLFSEVF
jgi:hypothetical protein